MDTWRIVGALIITVGGLMLVLVAMAQTRDGAVRGRGGPRRGPSSARVIRTGLLGLAVLAVVVLLAVSVLPQVAVWTAAALIWLLVGVLILID